MATTIQVTITKCYECPHYNDGSGMAEDWCDHPDAPHDGEIIAARKISIFCPILKEQGKRVVEPNLSSAEVRHLTGAN